MYPSVRSSFREFNEAFEGAVEYMYLDILGLVTVGVGNLIDPVSAATELPFRWKNKPGVANPGQPATQAEIAEEWTRIKKNTALAHKGHLACKSLTNLELADESIDTLITRRVNQNETFLRRQKPFNDFDNWPADAQMGLLSMAWAMGPGGPGQFHNFSAACEKMDFDNAAVTCRMKEQGNPGVVPRNQADKRLFENAAAVLAGEDDFGFARSMFYYPQIIMKPTVITGD